MTKSLPLLFGLWVWLAVEPAACFGQERDASTTAAETNVQDSLRAYLLLQEQIHTTQLSIESNRRETDAAAARNAAALAARLESLEQFLTEQRRGELETMRTSNRALLLIGATFGGVAFVMLLMGYFQWRTIQRLTSPGARRLRGPLAAGEAASEAILNDPAPPAGSLAEASNLRLLGALDRLERRLLQLEHSTQASLGTGASETASGSTHGHPGHCAPAHSGAPAPTTTGPAARVKELIDKGQSLLDQSKPKDALACFEEALRLDPANAEALVKKGTTFERLQQPDQAIECYDRAIAADRSFTIAYLHKGGLFNRLERFTEALECYKLALRTQK